MRWLTLTLTQFSESEMSDAKAIEVNSYCQARVVGGFDLERIMRQERDNPLFPHRFLQNPPDQTISSYRRMKSQFCAYFPQVT